MWRLGVRLLSTGSATTSAAEQKIVSKLKGTFTKAKVIEAADISGELKVNLKNEIIQSIN